MEYHLKTFSTWLRYDMALSDDIEIVIDRAAIPTERKQKPTTRWDHLAKQQSFTMPKVPSRRRLGDTIEEDKVTSDSCPRMIKQTSFCLPRGRAGSRLGGDADDGAARPGMGAKQTSLSSLPRQTSFKHLTEDEQMEMPRLLKQSSFKSQSRRRSDAGQSIGSRPKHPSRPRRHSVSRDSPKNDSDNDEANDILSSMPLLVKQMSFTVAGHSSRGILIGDGEKEGNEIDRRRQMAKQDSLTMLRRRSLTCSSETDKVSNGSNRRLQMAKQKSLTMPRRPTRTFDSEDNPFEMTNSLSSTLRLVEQAQHLYTGKAHASNSEVRHGSLIARTNRPRGRTGRD
jgi:hypothetical protein